MAATAAAAVPGGTASTDCGGDVDRFAAATAAAAAAAALATSMFGLTLPRHMADAGTLYSRRRSLTDNPDNPLCPLYNLPSFDRCFVESSTTRESREMSRRPTSVSLSRSVGARSEVNVIGPSITFYDEKSLPASEQSEIHSGNGTRGAAISGRKPNLLLSCPRLRRRRRRRRRRHRW